MFPLDLLPPSGDLLKALPFSTSPTSRRVFSQVRAPTSSGAADRGGLAIALILFTRWLYAAGCAVQRLEAEELMPARALPPPLLRVARFAAHGTGLRANSGEVVVEALWLAILAFYELVFAQTKDVAGWERNRYLFFVGCHYPWRLIETLFLRTYRVRRLVPRT